MDGWRHRHVILGAKPLVTCTRVFIIQVSYEVAPVVRPILSVDTLMSNGVQVVFGVGVNSSCIQLPDEHIIPMIRENGAMVLNVVLVDKSDMRNCEMVAPSVPLEMLSAVFTAR